MPVINRRNYPFVRLDALEDRTYTFYHELKEDDPIEYFYLEFFCPRAFNKFPIRQILGDTLYFRLLGDSNFKLILNNSHEAFHYIVPHLYHHLYVVAGIPPHKIIIVTESADLHTIISDYADKNGFPKFNVEWFTMFKIQVQADYEYLVNDFNFTIDTLQDKFYSKFYLNFNRRWRDHRPLFVALLIASGLLDKGYVSLGKSDMSSRLGHLYENFRRFVEPNLYLSKLLDDARDLINETDYLYLDYDNLEENRATLETGTKPYYENSLFSLVSETNFYKDGEVGRFLSEKTWKPIVFKHPFIMISVPRMMKLLRLQGYKTFHPYIDESYDGEHDPLKRLELIIREVSRLCNMNEKELLEFRNALRPIVEYNHHRLLQDKKYITKFYVN